METMEVNTKRVANKDLVKLASEIGPRISQQIEEEEKNGRLSATTVKALRDAGFHKLYLPASLGGLEADPLTVAKVVEEVARHNTAAAWSLMVTNTTLFITSHLPEKGVEEIFGNDPDAFIAGTVHPPMRATRTEKGFQLNGRNPLVSNVHEAQWVFTTALVMEGDQVKIIEGHPAVIGAILKIADCKILDTWQVLGMRATDSNDVEATNVQVPDHLSFPLTPEFTPGSHYGNPLFKSPSACTNIASLLPPVALAVAQNSIDELKALATKKTPLGSMVPLREKGVVQRKLGQAQALVDAGRANLHDKIGKCWKKVEAGETISFEEKAGLVLAAAHANQSSAQAVELVYTAAGTSGIYTKNKLSHYYTDMQVIRQHGFMNESRFETGAQMLLGLPPDVPIVAL